MKNPKIWINFYEHMAFLGYSIAAADKKVHSKEIAALRQLLRKEWLELEDSVDEFGSDAAFQIETVFDWLIENSPSSEYAFEKFHRFVKEHPAFIKGLKQNILKTAGGIADAFSGINKTELSLLFRLEKLLDIETVKNESNPNLNTV